MLSASLVAFALVSASPAQASTPLLAGSDAKESTGITVNGEDIALGIPLNPVNTGNSLDPENHMQCWVYRIESRKIGTYEVKTTGSFSGKVKLLCGTPEKYGYLHIEARHKSQWAKAVKWDQRGSESNWDNLMRRVVKGNLKAPTKIYAEENSKLCYSGSFVSWRKKGNTIVAQKTFNSAVVVSKNTKRVITAYPGRCKGNR